MNDVSTSEHAIAMAAAEHMFDQKPATAERPGNPRAWIESMLYKPEYRAEA